MQDTYHVKFATLKNNIYISFFFRDAVVDVVIIQFFLLGFYWNHNFVVYPTIR